MVDQSLLNYIWSYLQQGYDAESIKSALLQQGYSQKAVDEGFRAVYASQYADDIRHPDTHTQRSKLHFSKAEIIAAIFLIIGLSAILVIMYGISNTSGTPEAPDTQQGSDTFSPTPEQQTSEDPGEEIPQQEPEDIFQEDAEPVSGEPDLVQPEQDTPDIPIDDTHQQRQLSRLEIDKKVEDLALSDPMTAATYCPQIITKNGENSCYARIALIAEQPKFCNYVSTEKQQDFCYMQFAIEGKGTQAICSNIRDAYRRESCLQLLVLQADIEDAEDQQNQATEGELSQQEIEEAFTDNRFVGNHTSA